MQGGGALEHQEQAVHPLPESWRAFYRAEGEAAARIDLTVATICESLIF
jgi:hypothetical protein